MNTHPTNHLEVTEPRPMYQESDIPQRWRPAIATGVVFLIAYYAWPWLAYETAIKRQLYELGASMIPTQFSEILHRSASHFASLPSAPHAGVQNAAEANQSYEGSGISSVVQRARSLSGIDRFLQPSTETAFAGLGNWDNSCFQNSVLQGLASLQAFPDFVRRSWALCAGAGISAATHEGLCSFLEQLQREVQGRHTLWPPSILRSMNTWQQQDAQEYYSKLMDAIEKEAKVYVKSMERQLAPSLACLRFRSKNGLRMESARADFDRTQDASNSTFVQSLPPANPVEGVMSQTLTCQSCGFSEGLSMMPFNCLTLNLGLGGHCDLEYLLDTHTEAELIEGVECDECTRLVSTKAETTEKDLLDDIAETAGHQTEQQNSKPRAKVLSTKAKRIMFGRLPQNLVLHINRSIVDEWGSQRKNTSLITFPLRLEISDDWVTCLDEGEREVHAVYELRCIVTHQGRHDNGHYVACGKRGKNWYSFNDELVTLITEENMLSRGHVFMLFYEEIDQQPMLQMSEPGHAEAQTSDRAPSSVALPHTTVEQRAGVENSDVTSMSQSTKPSAVFGGADESDLSAAYKT